MTDHAPRLDARPEMTNIIREVFGYIHLFRNQVFVLKIDDVLFDAPDRKSVV